MFAFAIPVMAPCFWWIFTHLQCHPKDGVFGRISQYLWKNDLCTTLFRKKWISKNVCMIRIFSNADFVCIGRHGIDEWHLGKLHKLQYYYMPLGGKTCYNSITEISYVINVNLSSYYSTHPLVLGGSYSAQGCVCVYMYVSPLRLQPTPVQGQQGRFRNSCHCRTRG